MSYIEEGEVTPLPKSNFTFNGAIFMKNHNNEDT